MLYPMSGTLCYLDACMYNVKPMETKSNCSLSNDIELEALGLKHLKDRDEAIIIDKIKSKLHDKSVKMKISVPWQEDKNLFIKFYQLIARK